MSWFSDRKDQDKGAAAPAATTPPTLSMEELQQNAGTALRYNAEIAQIEGDAQTPDRLEARLRDGQTVPIDLTPIRDLLAKTPPAEHARTLSSALAQAIEAGRRTVLTLADRDRLLPVLHRFDTLPDTAGLVMARFSETVRVLFELDHGAETDRSPEYITSTLLQDMSLAPDALMALAIQNLNTRARGHVSVSEVDRSPFSRVHLNNHLESSLMLHAPFWDNMAEQSDGVLAACLGKGTVILAPDRIHSVEHFSRVRKELSPDITHPLSQKLWRWTGDGWHQVAT